MNKNTEKQLSAASVKRPVLMLPKVAADFEINGKGASSQWEKADWAELTPIRGDAAYQTKFKALYSNTGVYFLFDCEDTVLSATITEDFGDLFTEDVVEVFLWPEESERVYFEYELSPLNFELPLLIVNNGPAFHGWKPWHLDSDRRTRRATAARGGVIASNAKVEGWTAEFFIPFALMQGLRNTPPVSGTKWRANMYRIDYDHTPTYWVWSRLERAAFHLIDQFGTIVFE